MPDRACTSCRQILTDDPCGLCLECQTDVVSQQPGSITAAQRDALIGLLMDQGMVPSGRSGDENARARRGAFIASVVPGWTWGGDLGVLSQEQAGDLLEQLEDRRLSREARGR